MEFDEILEKDEKIIKVIKPNKKRYLRNFFDWWIILVPIVLVLYIVGTLTIVPLIIYIKLIKKGYKNAFYICTNKRLIVREGVIWINVTSLEYRAIKMTNVRVGFMDRRLRTGSLKFASSTIHSNSSSLEHSLSFGNIDNPYETLTEIKGYIDERKK